MTGCVTHIKPTALTNAPPAERFANFSTIELLPLADAAPHPSHRGAMEKIQQNVDIRLNRQIQTWNQRKVDGPVRTLVIHPEIGEMKFVGGGKRFLTGALSGSSAVVLRAKFIEKETNKEIATAEFYSKAAAEGGAWTFGATDNIMLVRIANSLAVYVLKNFDAAVGGPVMPTAEPAPEQR